MIKNILTLLLLLFTSFLHVTAQKKDISQAKTLLKSGKDLERAEELMRKVLADTTKVHPAKNWDLLFDIIKKQYDNVNELVYLKQKYDTVAVFNTVLKMFEVVAKIDSSLGKDARNLTIQAKHQKKYSDILNQYRPNLYNGGLFFINKKDFNKAYTFLDTYINCANNPFFKDYHYQTTDPLIPNASYWAVYCGYKLESPQKALRHAYLALKDKEHHPMMLQYLADTYRMENDTVRYLETLREGFQEYPTIPFFYIRSIDHYSELNQWSKVLTLSEGALTHSKENSWLQVAKSTALLNLEKYSECIELCDSVIQKVDTIPEFYLNAGLAYFNQAIQLDKNKNTSNKQIHHLYVKAKPYLERYRVLMPTEFNKWSLPLYTIYLNLNMGKEFDEIDKLIKRSKNKISDGYK